MYSSSNAQHIVLSCNTAWNLYNFRRGMIRKFIALGKRVSIVAPPDEYSDRLEALGCEMVGLPMDNKGTHPLRDALLLWRYFRIYRQLNADAVLHFTIKPVIYGGIAARMLGIPYVSNITGLGTAFLRDNWLTQLVKTLYRFSQQEAQTVFFQNRDDRDLFTADKLVPAERCAILPGSGIDLVRFAYAPIPATAEAPVFLLVARLLWDKGVGEFVEAARAIRSKYPQARFQLLGFVGVENPTAIDRATIDGWVREGIVEYLGSTDDVRPHVEQASCIVLPSYREGTPRSLLEAAAMGRPTITTDVPGCRNVVDDGVGGLLCRVRDAHDLEHQMERFIRMHPDQWRKMGLAGRRKVEREFDEAIVIDAYLDMLQSVAAKESPATR